MGAGHPCRSCTEDGEVVDVPVTQAPNIIMICTIINIIIVIIIDIIIIHIIVLIIIHIICICIMCMVDVPVTQAPCYSENNQIIDTFNISILITLIMR